MHPEEPPRDHSDALEASLCPVRWSRWLRDGLRASGRALEHARGASATASRAGGTAQAPEAPLRVSPRPPGSRSASSSTARCPSRTVARDPSGRREARHRSATTRPSTSCARCSRTRAAASPRPSSASTARSATRARGRGLMRYTKDDRPTVRTAAISALGATQSARRRGAPHRRSRRPRAIPAQATAISGARLRSAAIARSRSLIAARDQRRLLDRDAPRSTRSARSARRPRTSRCASSSTRPDSRIAAAALVAIEDDRRGACSRGSPRS